MGSKLDDGPIADGVTITPSATALVKPIRGFHVGVSGDVQVKTLAGTTLLFKSCQAGAFYPYACTHVLTGSTATDIVGLF